MACTHNFDGEKDYLFIYKEGPMHFLIVSSYKFNELVLYGTDPSKTYQKILFYQGCIVYEIQSLVHLTINNLHSSFKKDNTRDISQ